MNSSVTKQARKDAYEYAAAYMSYGEGAGTRRKLIEGTVDYKMHFVPGYREEFAKASEQQNMAKHAKTAKVDGRRKAINQTVARNTKAVVSGKYENVNTGILFVGAVAVILHKTGYDKKLVAGAKKKAKQARQYFRKTGPKPAPKKKATDGTVYSITDVQ